MLKLEGVSTAKIVLFHQGSTELRKCENCVFFLPVNILMGVTRRLLGPHDTLPCVLIQESLGFSPFELVFGRVVRGPLKETWLAEDIHSNILDHVSDLHDRLFTAARLAQTNLKDAQGRMKQWYDKRARPRTFKPGNKVLVLLPIHHHPLQARYCGPYVIEKKLNEVDYVVYMPDCRKQ